MERLSAFIRRGAPISTCLIELRAAKLMEKLIEYTDLII